MTDILRRPASSRALFLCGALLWSSLALAESWPVDGVIYPLEERALALSANGLVTELTVRQGERVDDQQVLLRLDSRVQELEAERQRVLLEDTTERQVLGEQLAIIEQQFDVVQELYSAAGSVSRDELDALRLERIRIRGELAQERSRKVLEELEYRRSREVLAQLELLAPMDGVITRIERRPGEWVSAGEPILHLVDMTAVLLKVNMPDAMARALASGHEMVARIAGVGQRAGEIVYVAAVADPASGLVEVHVRLDNVDGAIRPGTQGQLLPAAAETADGGDDDPA